MSVEQSSISLSGRCSQCSSNVLFVNYQRSQYTCQGADAVQHALDAGAAAAQASGRALAAAATEGVAEKCIAVLKQMRAISTTHRMVNRFAASVAMLFCRPIACCSVCERLLGGSASRVVGSVMRCALLTSGATRRPLPTRASHYVASILAPLSSLLDDPAAAALRPEPRREIAEGIMLATTARYQSMASEMLDTVRGSLNLQVFRWQTTRTARTTDLGVLRVLCHLPVWLHGIASRARQDSFLAVCNFGHIRIPADNAGVPVRRTSAPSARMMVRVGEENGGVAQAAEEGPGGRRRGSGQRARHVGHRQNQHAAVSGRAGAATVVRALLCLYLLAAASNSRRSAVAALACVSPASVDRQRH